MSKSLNLVLICGLLGTVLMAWMSPAIISILFTPPVSFGTNCEPAADWAMRKMLGSQLFGFVCGAGAGVAITLWMLQRRRRKEAEATSHPIP